MRADEGEENRLFAEIRRHGIAREIPLVVETLRAFADGRVQVKDKQPVDGAGEPVAPRDLTDEIERVVEAMLA